MAVTGVYSTIWGNSLALAMVLIADSSSETFCARVKDKFFLYYEFDVDVNKCLNRSIYLFYFTSYSELPSNISTMDPDQITSTLGNADLVSDDRLRIRTFRKKDTDPT